MKKLALTMMSLAFVLFFSSTASAFQSNKPKVQSQPQAITYEVVVILTPHSVLCSKYTINIRDEMGNLVAKPIEYVEGKRTYVFHESGPVIGARIATMEKMDGSRSYCNFMAYIQPAQKFGHFMIGHTYQFFLYPWSMPADK
jgi:hypothetical protein